MIVPFILQKFSKHKPSPPIPSDFKERAFDFDRSRAEYEKCLSDFRAMLDENQKLQMDLLQMRSQQYSFASDRLRASRR